MNNQYADENRPINKILQSTVRDVECGWKQDNTIHMEFTTMIFYDDGTVAYGNTNVDDQYPYLPINKTLIELEMEWSKTHIQRQA
jgi:hypothetical protein